MRPINILLLVSCLAISATALSCNMTGGIDNPQTQPETVADAQTKMDTGDYQGAVNELIAIGSQNDKSLQMLGSAYLGLAGATANRIDGALGSYNTSSANLTVIGTLANQLVPAATNGDSNISLGVAAFNIMGNTNFRSLWQIYGNIVGIANLEAAAAGASTAVARANIANNCSASISNCGTIDTTTTCLAAGMSDAMANEAINYMNAAANAAQNTSLSQVASLVTTLRNLFGGTFAAGVMRCVLVTQTLSN